METINKKERNMKQQTNPNTEEYEIIEEKKPVKDVKEQSTNYQQLPEVTMTKQNDINITISSKGKTTTRSQITERRLGATKWGQLIQEQDGENKDSCPNCKNYVGEGVKCEEEEEYPDKIPYLCSMDRKKIEEKLTRQWK